jgi:hypothetical protein
MRKAGYIAALVCVLVGAFIYVSDYNRNAPADRNIPGKTTGVGRASLAE